VLEGRPPREHARVLRPAIHRAPLAVASVAHGSRAGVRLSGQFDPRARVCRGGRLRHLALHGLPDAEGTLGGLVEAGRRIATHLRAALQMAELCSNDPVCAHHRPDDRNEARFLHGAACHGCLLISETSCEQRNDYLDRALVVPTVENLGAELFEHQG